MRETRGRSPERVRPVARSLFRKGTCIATRNQERAAAKDLLHELVHDATSFSVMPHTLLDTSNPKRTVLCMPNDVGKGLSRRPLSDHNPLSVYHLKVGRSGGDARTHLMCPWSGPRHLPLPQNIVCPPHLHRPHRPPRPPLWPVSRQRFQNNVPPCCPRPSWTCLSM